jgi:SMC interacting uncharacterized protein involved in chromosome segregation
MLPEDPVTPLFQYGVTTGAAIISVGLFIWTKIESSILKSSVDQMGARMERSLEVLTKLADHLYTVESNMLQLVKDHQSGMQRLLEGQAVMVAHQVNMGQGTQQLVEQLIDILKDKG